jgi:hypothetical protein
MNTGSKQIRGFSNIILLLSLILTSLALPQPVYAGGAVTLLVDTTADNASLTACTPAPGDCSLRGAIQHVNADTVGTPPAYEILLGMGTYTLTGAAGEDLNTSGDLDTIPQNTLYITGIDRSVTFINGNHVDRVFDHKGPGQLFLTSLTIQNGQVATLSGGGGGVRNTNSADMVLTLVTVDSNTVLGTDGSDDRGGGIRNSNSQLSLDHTVISHNQADSGGGLTLDNTTLFMDHSIINSNHADANFGGGIDSSGGGVFTIYRSQIINNTALQAGGFYNNTAGILNMFDSTIAGNSTLGYGGGGMILFGTSYLERVTISGNSVTTGAYGGGLAVFGIANLVNVTIAENTAKTGGGIYIGKNANVGFNHVTAANNSADDGFGSAVFMDDEGTASGGTFSFTNSIFSSYEPETNTCIKGTTGTFSITDLGYNLFDQTLNCYTHVFTDQTYAYPALGTLAYYGGWTATLPLNSFSDAIDTASPGDPAVDQRNHSRKDGDGDGLVAADIGAYEYESASVYIPLIRKP